MVSIKDYTCEHGTRLTQFCSACSWEMNMASYTGKDMVNHPPHYKVGGIEAIDYIQAKLTAEEFAGFCKGNALKYISRANHKKDATEDLRKAIWYLDRLVTPEGN
jgi:hypothetical protein